jgi:hypothetical protein
MLTANSQRKMKKQNKKIVGECRKNDKEESAFKNGQPQNPVYLH